MLYNLKKEIQVHYAQKFSSHLAEITVCSIYKDHPVNAV